MKKRSEEFGLRDTRLIGEIAERNGFEIERSVEMPAGNWMLVFRVKGGLSG